jgi:putative ABC transport system substrate-binding protein
MTEDLTGKRLELLKEAVPSLSRVALLIHFSTPSKERAIKLYQTAAEALGISLWPVEISNPDDIEPAFDKIAQDHADGILRGPGPGLFNWRAQVGASALKHRLPVMTYIAEEIPHGLLMSYGQDLPDFFRRAVAYTDKILKGAKPAELPVEQPTKFKLVLNLKAAKELGITFPQSLIVSADEIIGA